MVVEILFEEVCNLYGDGQNATYLKATLPEAEFIFTAITQDPYFVNNTPDMIYIGSMSEATQRRVIQKLMPYKDRLQQIIDEGIPFLATGNAGEIFAKKIEYITEKITIDGLGILDTNVKTNWFDRYNGKVIGQLDDITIVGFRSQFSFFDGDNNSCYFVKCQRGDGIRKGSKLEGYRRNNLIVTQILGPILPLNPLFCEYFIALCGVKTTAAFKDAAMTAYEQRIKEFSDPKIAF